MRNLAQRGLASGGKRCVRIWNLMLSTWESNHTPGSAEHTPRFGWWKHVFIKGRSIAFWNANQSNLGVHYELMNIQLPCKYTTAPLHDCKSQSAFSCNCWWGGLIVALLLCNHENLFLTTNLIQLSFISHFWINKKENNFFTASDPSCVSFLHSGRVHGEALSILVSFSFV